MDTLGDIIRQHRKKLKLTTEALAKMVKVDRSYISKIERYNYVPSYKVYAEIEKALNMPRSYRKLFLDSSLKPFNEYEKRSKQLEKIEKDLEKLGNYLDKLNFTSTGTSFHKELIKKLDGLKIKRKKSHEIFEKEYKKRLS